MRKYRQGGVEPSYLAVLCWCTSTWRVGMFALYVSLVHADSRTPTYGAYTSDRASGLRYLRPCVVVAECRPPVDPSMFCCTIHRRRKQRIAAAYPYIAPIGAFVRYPRMDMGYCPATDIRFAIHQLPAQRRNHRSAMNTLVAKLVQ